MPWNSLNWATNRKFGLDSLELFTILLMQLKCMVTVHTDCTLQDLICCWEYPTAIRRCPSSSWKCLQAVFGLSCLSHLFFFFSSLRIHSFAAANSFSLFVKHFGSCFIHKNLYWAVKLLFFLQFPSLSIQHTSYVFISFSQFVWLSFLFINVFLPCYILFMQHALP